MKQHVLLGLLTLVAALLSGCAQSAEGTSPQDQRQAVQTATPTSATSSAPATPTGRIAPPYEEIKRGFERLQRKPQLSETPGGDDAALDPQLDEALYAYSESLVGLEAVDWQGWYYGFIDGETPEKSTVSLLMEEPKVGVEYPTQVLIISPSPDLAAKARSWQIGQPVLVNGALAGIDSEGTVVISNATLEERK